MKILTIVVNCLNSIFIAPNYVICGLKAELNMNAYYLLRRKTLSKVIRVQELHLIHKSNQFNVYFLYKNFISFSVCWFSSLFVGMLFPHQNILLCCTLSLTFLLELYSIVRKFTKNVNFSVNYKHF